MVDKFEREVLYTSTHSAFKEILRKVQPRGTEGASGLFAHQVWVTERSGGGIVGGAITAGRSRVAHVDVGCQATV